MRAISLSEGINAQSVVNAAAAEIDEFKKEYGSLSNAVLVLSVRTCIDQEKENGTTPQRKA